MRLGVAVHPAGATLSGIGAALLGAARDLGLDGRFVPDDDDEASVDVLIAVGSAQFYPAVLSRAPRAHRILWHIEPLPAAASGLNVRIHRALPTGWLIDRAIQAVPRLSRSASIAAARETAEREREQRANARALRRHRAAFDRVFVDTQDRSRRAALAGIHAPAVPVGYHADMAGPLADGPGERDIPVLLLARLHQPLGRRRRLLSAVTRELSGAGVEVAVQSEFVGGTERRALLERTRIVLDIHRMPETSETIRYVLATAAGAVMVTEPAADRGPVLAGTHLVQARPEEMARATVDLLADDERRQAMVSAGRALLVGELSMTRALERLLADARPRR